jgi:uncharacterized protein (TIGR02449 family)
MDELFHTLKSRITRLIECCKSLKEANNHLHQTQFLLMREKEILQAKHKVAISQIESMVFRLKSLEKPQ